MKSAPAPYSITTTAPILYDHQNLPLSITRAGDTTTYRYNEAGQRVAKQVGTGNTEVYLLDGASSLGVFTVSGTGSVVSSYFNVLAGDKVIGRQPHTGNRRYYHTDLLGSTRAVVEGATVVESYDFEPWGLLMPGRTLAGSTKEGFTSKERDAETGLDYFGARYYMAALGRWTTVDPPADSFPEWSPYNYVFNNPLLFTDPFGLCPPHDADVSDCGYDNVGEAWRALASTTVGSQLIADIVAGGFTVEQRTFADKDPCGTHSCNLGKTITLNEAVSPGALAAAIGHEYEHSTQKIATTEQEAGQKELAAWDATLRIAKGLHDPYRSQAMTEYEDTFKVIQGGAAARAAAVKQWGCRAAQKAGLPCSP
ncbi:MAG: RHS repeat domain-containing protein [Gammaproteobacteria bacterium]